MHEIDKINLDWQQQNKWKTKFNEWLLSKGKSIWKVLLTKEQMYFKIKVHFQFKAKNILVMRKNKNSPSNSFKGWYKSYVKVEPSSRDR